ncbi:MAG: hypothetical protein ACREJD_02615 [Phycisphaerales bacterium]
MPHPKIRKTTKWGGAALTVLLVVAWIGSMWVSANWWIRHEWSVQFRAGCLVGAVFEGGGGPPNALSFEIQDPREPLRWWFLFEHFEGNYGVAIPLWILIMPILFVSGIAWRFDALARRLARFCQCAKCGYDLSSTGAGKPCPECGKAQAAKA